MDWYALPEKLSKPMWIGLGVMVLGGVAVLDYLTGVELTFTLFYLVPVGLFSWAVSGTAGLVVAFISASIWLAVELLSGTRYSNTFVYLWNAIIRLGFFLLPVFMIRLGKAIDRERMFARTDYLTGALNGRFFRELAQMEIDRAARYKHPFTLAFVDVDDFKKVNDTYGHTVGDAVLRAVASTMKEHLRKTDLVARVGGDEFVILLPETGAETARVVIAHLQDQLLEAMRANHWPATFSIGVLSVTSSLRTIDEVLSQADQIMYAVKKSGKNNIHYATDPVEIEQGAGEAIE